MQVQDCRGWDSRSFLDLPAVKGRGHEHSRSHHAMVSHLKSHLGRANVGIEDGTDVADDTSEDLIGISVQANVGFFSEAHIREIVLIYVTQNPNGAKVGDGKRIGRGQPLHARRICYLLIGDNAGDRSTNFDNACQRAIKRWVA